MAGVMDMVFNRCKITWTLVLLNLVVHLTVANKKGFYFDYIGSDYRILRLRCHAGAATEVNDILTITIKNATSDSRLAYVTKGRQPTIETRALEKSIFLSGGFPAESYHPVILEILIIDYESFLDQAFQCDIGRFEKSGVKTVSWTVSVNKTITTTTSIVTTVAGAFTDAPYRVGAVKEKGEDTDSLPMTVLIVMLVLISILLFLAVFLLLHRYRSRCQRRDEEMYRPPAYCMAPEHHLDWGGNSIKSKGSARTLNSRSHYSIAAHHMHMPLPPIPHSTVPRRGRNNTYRRPPSVGSSVKVPYVQPQDAIGQESSEDGEIAALSSGSPKVHYKSPRERLSSQNSPLYACVPVSTTDE